MMTQSDSASSNAVAERLLLLHSNDDSPIDFDCTLFALCLGRLYSNGLSCVQLVVVPNEPLHAITIVVAILFLGYGVITALVLEWLWNNHLSLQNGMYSLNRFSWYNERRPAIRLIATILLWFASFTWTTYVL